MNQETMMEIKVNIRHRNESGPTLAYASVELGGCFVIRDVRVVEGKNGLFAAMPSRRVGDKFEDLCFPRTRELRQRINDAVLEAYQAEQEAEA